jgi:hypothetical protein
MCLSVTGVPIMQRKGLMRIYGPPRQGEMVTLVTTDIHGSTTLWDSYPEEVSCDDDLPPRVYVIVWYVSGSAQGSINMLMLCCCFLFFVYWSCCSVFQVVFDIGSIGLPVCVCKDVLAI